MQIPQILSHASHSILQLAIDLGSRDPGPISRNLRHFAPPCNLISLASITQTSDCILLWNGRININLSEGGKEMERVSTQRAELCTQKLRHVGMYVFSQVFKAYGKHPLGFRGMQALVMAGLRGILLHP